MKKLLFILTANILFLSAPAQDFATHLTTARTSYKGGKLDDARFAMEQMLQEIDIAVGKEVLKVLPMKMQDIAANVKKDNVSGSSGFFGVTIHREFGEEAKDIRLEIISNSPMLASINSILSLPLLGASGDHMVIKVAGYKGLLQKVARSTPDQADETEAADKKKKSEKDKASTDNNDYELQLPLNNSLITFRAPGYSKDEVMKMVNTIPVADIAKLLQ
jgi:hypothetical protein